MGTVTETRELPGAGAALTHESAYLHVSGEAEYVDDQPEPRGMLFAAIGCSAKAHARIRHIDFSDVQSAPGVVEVITAEDIPGDNNHGPILADDPVFADGLVEYVGQSVFAVLADTVNNARRAARRARIDYEELPAILDIDSAMAQQSFVIPSQTIERGRPEQAIAGSAHQLQGRLRTGGQDHFYLEGQIAVALPREDGAMLVHASTQHPTEVQHLVAHALGKSSKDVVV
ncbi:MAG: molybdopterin-dependent oxidoreductase, partial [Gammaproteobacteria bacterium]|nr:molybdopterin-dependent oxidoreductase [Gammaproteobacteria bacterium]